MWIFHLISKPLNSSHLVANPFGGVFGEVFYCVLNFVDFIFSLADLSEKKIS